MVAQVYLRSANMLHFEVEIHFNMIRDLNEWDTLVHPVVLAIEDHFPSISPKCPSL